MSSHYKIWIDEKQHLIWRFPEIEEGGSLGKIKLAPSMTAEVHMKLGRVTALVSFLLGTVIFGLYYLTSASELLFIGYGYIVLAGLINIGILIPLLFQATKDTNNKSKFLMTGGFMLLNLPVLLIYVWITSILLNTMRIKFINDTGAILTDINIVGCDGEHINKLEVGESKTVWVRITSDCAIYIDYLTSGQRKGETVATYVTSSMGQKMNHKIDGMDKDII